MNHKKNLRTLRKIVSLCLTVCCLSSSLLAAPATALSQNRLETNAEVRAAALDLLRPLASLLSRTLTQFEADQAETAPESAPPVEQNIEAVVEVVKAAPATAYYPTYEKAVAYNKSLAVPAMAESRSQYLGEFKVTFYCPCSKCCGKYANGATASGAKATEGRTIAVDRKKIPLGSKLYVEGFGDFIAEDVGGAIKGNKVDIFVNSHTRAYQLGVIKATSVYLVN